MKAQMIESAKPKADLKICHNSVQIVAIVANNAIAKGER